MQRLLRRGRAFSSQLVHLPLRTVFTAHPPAEEPSDACFDALLRLRPGAEPEALGPCSAASLGVAPRDVDLLLRTTWCVPPSSLLWRADRLYGRLAPVKFVLTASDCLIFDAGRGAVKAAAQAASSAGNAVPRSSFATAVLESLFAASTGHARARLARLSAAADAALADVAASHGRAREADAVARLVPLERSLDALSSDVAELQDALGAHAQAQRPGQALQSEGLTAAGLAPRASAALRRARAVAGELRELRQHLNSAREVRGLQLHGARNALQRLELRTSLAVLALAIGSAPATFLGANLPNGLESSAMALPTVAALGAVAAGAAFSAGAAWARGVGAAAPGAGAAQSMAAVLASLDAIDDALAVAGADGGLTQEQLREALAAACPPRFAGRAAGEELALLYRIYDGDGDGRLTAAEWSLGAPRVPAGR